MEKTILAIDDDKAFLSTLRDIFEPEGFDLKTLSDSTKAEEYIDKYHPDLLIIDIFMPGRSGFNLLEDFKDKGLYQNLPKIFLTCLDDDVEKMTARSCGVEHYVTKPFQPEELIRRIKKILA
ncbi:MAG: response regulator [Candidatus Omnitrophica bacterium]|nr:response regulator [Candidatus Omnitrophota bacterium]